MSYLDEKGLSELGLKSFGSNVLISSKASIYSAHEISVGSNVRIDDFCVLSGNIQINDFVHLATNVVLTATVKPIKIGSFSTLSYGCVAFTASDDFIGPYYSNPTLPKDLRNVHHAEIIIGQKCAVGAGSILLPGCTLQDGVSLGALTLGKDIFTAWGVYVGHNKKRIHDRNPY
jgi:acetyltransferase-like isoleucine patch superfamily enzyme